MSDNDDVTISVDTDTSPAGIAAMAAEAEPAQEQQPAEVEGLQTEGEQPPEGEQPANGTFPTPAPAAQQQQARPDPILQAVESMRIANEQMAARQAAQDNLIRTRMEAEQMRRVSEQNAARERAAQEARNTQRESEKPRVPHSAATPDEWAQYAQQHSQWAAKWAAADTEEKLMRGNEALTSRLQNLENRLLQQAATQASELAERQVNDSWVALNRQPGMEFLRNPEVESTFTHIWTSMQGEAYEQAKRTGQAPRVVLAHEVVPHLVSAARQIMAFANKAAAPAAAAANRQVAQAQRAAQTGVPRPKAPAPGGPAPSPAAQNNGPRRNKFDGVELA